MTTTPPNAPSIFGRALEIESPAGRAAYLDEACGPDAGLRAEVEGLLAAAEKAGAFMRRPAAAELTAGYEPLTEGPGTIIGRYKLLQQIGEGGFGIVYMAEQKEPVKRRVALKIIKPGMDTREVVARFEAERQALALMDHPNIAKVLDAGTTETGRPYFVMELVKGVSIAEFCDQNQLPARARLELFVPVCQAVQHAHQKGVIHRDLKPSNILVTLHDGQPVPKVIDFGVAKALNQELTEKTLFTAYGHMVGTPQYMSPEQAEMSGLDVDTRSDVYSLGVVLYELLTGTTPLEAKKLRSAAYEEMQRLIREEEAQRPSLRVSTLGERLSVVARDRHCDPVQLQQLLRGELDWIVMKALEKDRTRRYETANGLARDLLHYLADEPVEACPPTTGYRLRKFARKNRKLLVTAGTFAAVLLLGVAASAWQAVRATQAEAAALTNEQQANANAAQAQGNEAEAKKERDEAQRQRDEVRKQRDEVKALNEKLESTLKELRSTQGELRRTLYAAHMNLAQHAWDAGGVEQVRELLDRHRPKMGETDLRNFEWHYLNRLCRAEVLNLMNDQEDRFYQFTTMALSPDGKRLATASDVSDAQRPRFVVAGAVKVWDVQTGKILLTLKGHAYPITHLAFSPDGQRLAGADGGDVKVWDAQTGKDLLSIKGGGGNVVFSSDGTRLATTSGGGVDQKSGIPRVKRVKVWDAQSGEELLTIESAFNCVAFSPDGKILATATDDNTVKLWDAKTGKELRALKGHTATVWKVAFSPDGKRLASAGWLWLPFGKSMAVKVWDTQTGKELLSIPDCGYSVAFSPDSKHLACGAWEGSNTVQVRDAQSGLELFTLKGDTRRAHSLAFSADGKRLAAAGYGAVRVWDIQIANSPLILQEGKPPFAFSPDGKRLASAGGTGGEVKVWDALTGQEQLTLKVRKARVTNLAFHPDGKRLATSGQDDAFSGQGGVRVCDAQTGKELLALKGAATHVVFSPDGKRLASACINTTVKVWDAQTGNELHILRPTGGGMWGFAAFSPDGKRLAYASAGRITVWDVETGRELLTFDNHRGYDVVFSPDGKRLASACFDKTVKVWDAQTGKRALTLKGHTGAVRGVAFSPDGQRLASASEDNTVKVWDAETGQELLSLKGGGSDVAFNSDVAFSPDGNRLAAGSANGTVMIWDATPLPEKP
jgi:WD40 repeat protein/serine/threonine protein kinase